MHAGKDAGLCLCSACEVHWPRDWCLEPEDATGCCHASLAFRRENFDRIGGWPLTKRGDVDQQLIAWLNAIEASGDPCQFADPSHIFRWGQTNAHHGQAFMQGPEDDGWYDRVRA